MHHRVVLTTLLAALLVASTVGPASAASDPRYGVPPDDSLARLAGTSVVDVADVARATADPATIADGAFAQAEAMPAWAWDISELALHLDYDPERAFEFVRDSIRFEPYAGILRGARGTLAARAGNATDRALLLSAILDEMLVPHRFAFARLDPDTAGRLVQRSLVEEAAPLDGPLPYPTEAILARAGRDYARLREALGDRLDSIVSDDWATAVDAARDHVWVQRALTAGWLDLDPTMPDAQPGDTLATADGTSQQPPDAEPWVVDLEVSVEHLEDGALVEQSILQHELEAIDAVGDGVFLVFRPELGTVAGAMTERLTGSEPWTPVLLMGGTEVAGTGFSVGGRRADLLGDTSEQPELTSIRLTISVAGPGTEPVLATRVILDRVPAGRRASGSSLGPEDLEPLARVDTAPVPLLSFRHLMVSTGATDLREHAYRRGALVGFLATLLDADQADRYGISGWLWPVAVADEGMVVASERVAVPGAGVAGGGYSFIARPRVFMTTLGPDPADPEREASSIDLLLDGVQVLGSGDGAEVDTASEQLWYGALQSAIETEFGLHRLPAELAADTILEGVSTAMSAPLHVIDPVPSPDLPPGTASALLEATADGRIVVVPGDVGTAMAWWTVDPRTGEARSILDQGPESLARQAADETPGPAGSDGFGTNLKYDGGVYNTRWGDYRPPPRPPRGPPPVCGSSNEEVTILECVSLRVAIPAAFFSLVVSFLVEAAAIQISWGW